MKCSHCFLDKDNNFYHENGKQKSWCKDCLREYKREKIVCAICSSTHTRNSYYRHLKSKKHCSISNVEHLSLVATSFQVGKTCNKCKVTKPTEPFHNNKSKKDHKKSRCKECLYTPKPISNTLISIKRGLFCTSCEKLVTKSKHENTTKHKNELHVVASYS
jgi:hypothetical protein